ncbi:reverse transcriptase domain-containing protein [Tanacetum coccineum]
MKQNGVSNEPSSIISFLILCASELNAWYDRLLRNSIHSFDDMMRKFRSKYFPPSMVTKLRNEITNFRQDPNESLFKAWEHYKMSIDRCPNHNMLLVTQIDTFYNSLVVKASGPHIMLHQEDFYENAHWKNVTIPKCETCGGTHSFTECPAVSGYTQEAAYAITGDLKFFATRSGVSYDGPSIPPTSSSLPKEVEREPELDVAPKSNPKPSIPYPSRLNDQKLREKANNQMLKFLQIFQRLHFDISFADALLHMPKFASTFKSLLSNKEKLFELANTPLNENCLAVLLKKLLEKLGDPGKFLIPCDFPKLDECLDLADLGASINLMPLSVWKNLSLSELTPTRMTFKLANRSVAYPVGVSKDVFVKVGKFYFPADFVVVDYDVDPQIPFILGRPFLRTA